MSLGRVLSVVPPLALSAATLAIGTAAATATARPAAAHHSLRLVAKPGRIAPASLLAPGDRVERLVELRARGRGRFAAVYFAARARRSSRLDADRVQGLRVELRSCPRRWKRRGAVYTCKRSRVILAGRPLVGRTRLKRLRLAGGQTAHLRLMITLPRGSAGSLAGQSTSAIYSFRGVRAKRR
jgi:hypothetical protein